VILRAIFLPLAMLALFPALAAAANWQVDDSRSRVGFAYQAMGSDIQGEFNRYTASIQFDPARPETAQVRMTVETASIDAGLPEATAEAVSANFLDAKRFPQAVFISSAVQALGQNRYRISGDLTLKNQRHPLSLTALLKPEGKGQRMTGTLQIKRLDYGIGTGMWGDTGTLRNEVQTAFSLLLMPAPASKPGARK
jgi:polyisoprenoid-binding protein YceI